MESHYVYYICPFRYRLKEIYKKCPDTDNTEISFRGLSLSHTHIGFSIQRGLIRIFLRLFPSRLYNVGESSFGRVGKKTTFYRGCN